MNVLLRLLKVIGIAILFILNENHDLLHKKTGIPTHLISAVMGFFLFFLLAELSRDVLTYLYKRRKKMAFKHTDNVLVGLNNIYFLILCGAGLYFILHLLKLKPSQFFTGLSLISAALAVIMKDYISNILSGMIMAFSDKLKIGDYIQLGDQIGEIIDFSLTMVTLKNDDDEIVYVPASTIYNHKLINYSSMDFNSVTVHFEINNKMKIPFFELDAKISEAMQVYKMYLADNGKGVLLINHVHQESTQFKYSYILKQKNILLNRKIKATILKVVYENTKLNLLL